MDKDELGLSLNTNVNIETEPEYIEMDKLSLSAPLEFLSKYNSPKEWILEQEEAERSRVWNGPAQVGPFEKAQYGVGQAIYEFERAPSEFLQVGAGLYKGLYDLFFPNSTETALDRFYNSLALSNLENRERREDLIKAYTGEDSDIVEWSSAIAQLGLIMASAGIGAGIGAQAARQGVKKLATETAKGVATRPEVVRRATQIAARKGAQTGAYGAIIGTMFPQEAGSSALESVRQYIAQTGDTNLKNYKPGADSLTALAVGTINSAIEVGFGVERYIPEFWGTNTNFNRAARRFVEGTLGEGAEEFTQSLVSQIGEIVNGYRDDIDWNEAWHNALIGGVLGGAAGSGMYYLNRRRMARQVANDYNMPYKKAAALVDEMLGTGIESTTNELSARSELLNARGNAWDKMVTGVKTAMETVDFGDEQTRNNQASQFAKTNVAIAIREAQKAGLSTDEFLDIAEFETVNNGQNLNMVFLKPLGSVQDIDNRIKAQDEIINRQKELKKTGADDKDAMRLAKQRKAILQKAKAIKQYNDAQYKAQIKAQTTPETAKEIETATKDVESVKGVTQAEFNSKVDTENLTSAEKSKRYGNAVLKSILPTKTSFDAVMVDPIYANAKQAIIAVADRINSFIKAHRTYGLKTDIANALQKMHTVNQGNFIDSVTTPDLDGVDVIAENAFLYHFLFSDATTIQTYLDSYITRAEDSLNQKKGKLSKKDLVGQSFKATDNAMQTQAQVIGAEYTSIYNEDGSYADKNVMAVMLSYQNQFVSEPTQIKSVDNRGTYSADTGNIYYQANIRDLFKPIVNEVRRFISDLRAAEKTDVNVGISVGELPAVYKSLGWKSGLVKTNRKVLLKDTLTKHNVDIDTVERLPELYSDPLMVFQSATEPDRLVAVLDATDKNGDQIIVALSPNKKEIGGYHFIPSFYGKEKFQRFLKDNIDKNRVKYIKDPAMSGALQSWSQALQGLDTNTILTQNDVVNQNVGQLFQGKKANGFYDPEIGVIVLGRNMNEMTLPHEMQHYWLDKIFSIYKRAKSGELQVRDEWMTETKALFDMLGIDENQTQLTEGQQEKFARMSEAYLTGIGVTGDMNATFKEYQQWVPEKYKSILNLGYLSDDGKVEYPFLDQGAVDFFNKWYANYSLPSLATSPERQEFINPEDENGEVLPVSIKEMNNRDKEFGNDAEEQVKTDQRLYNTLDENMPAEIKVEADGQKVVQASRSNFLKESEKQQRRWFERKSRDTEAQLAQDYIEKNPEHAKEVVYGDPELIPNDTGIDRATLINAYMALNNITPENEDWATLQTNIAINQSLAGTQLALSNNTSYRTYLDALREIENAREMKAATNYAGAKEGARERFNRDIQRFVDEELSKVLATAPNSEARDIALKSLFERARTKFSGNTTGGVLNQIDFDYARGQKGASAAFTRWAVNQIKKDAGAKLNSQEQAHLLNLSAKAQQAVIDLDDRDVGKAVAGAQEIRKWQVEKDKLMGVKPKGFSLFGDYAPRAMLASFNTLVVSNIPSTAMNTAVVRMLESGVFGKNEVSASLTDSEIKRIKAIYSATAMNLAQMERPTSPSLLHGEKYSSSGQKWYDPFTILGKEDNWFRVPTFVNTLARIATQDAKATGKNADDVFKEYCRLENQSDEAKLARKQALAVSNMAVFTQDGSLARALNGIRDWLNKGSRALVGLDPNGFGIGTLISPFLKTGANIAEMGFRGSIAPITTISALVQSWRSGKAIDPMKKLALAMDWTYFLMSSVMVALLAALTSDDDDFYTEPYQMGKKYDPSKPYDSINIAGVWIDLDFFGPFAIPIRTGCRLVQQWKRDNLSAIYKAYGQGAKYAAMDTPLLESIFNNQMSYATKKPEDWATGWAYNQVNKLIPAQIKPLSRAISSGKELDMGWAGKVIERKFHRNYGWSGAELTTQDLIDIFSTKFTYQP